MEFSKENVVTTINCNAEHIGMYGYFANNLMSLETAVTLERTRLKAVYCRLDYILDCSNERRLGTEVGNFSLFYPLDKEKNVLRY